MYDGLINNPTYVEKMGTFRYDKKKLEQERKLVQAVEQADLAQEHEKAEAQRATRIRDEKMEKLDDWMATYTSVLRIALEDDPQFLEELGIGPAE